MEAEDLVERSDNFAAPPTGAVNELQDVGNEDEIEGQVSNRNKSLLSDLKSKLTLIQTQSYTHGF